MKCKYCQGEMDENTNICPHCGKDNSGPVEEKSNGMDKTKLWLSIAAIAAVALLGVGLILITLFGVKGGWEKDKDKDQTLSDTTPAQTTPVPTEYVPGEGVLIRQSYSMDSFDENPALKDLVVAKVGDHTLTNAQLQMYYWMQFYEVWNYYYSQYSYYTSYVISLDYTLPFAEQTIPDGSMNWEQYLLDLSVNTWQRYLVLGMMAEDAGFELSADSQADMEKTRSSLEEAARENGLADANELIEQEMGDGVTLDDYMAYMELYYLGEEYFATIYSGIEYTVADLEGYFEANKESFGESGITKESGYIGDVRHILIMPEGGEAGDNGYMIYTEEEWAAALIEAQSVLDMWLADPTEENFIALTGQYTQDTGYASNGGFYSDVYSGSGYVEAFENWTVDPARKPGDCEIVRTDYGYHIMYMVSSEPMWERYCREGYLSDYCTKLIDEQVTKYPLEVDYENIFICNVSFG